jgi:hypothetical protein
MDNASRAVVVYFILFSLNRLDDMRRRLTGRGAFGVLHLGAYDKPSMWWTPKVASFYCRCPAYAGLGRYRDFLLVRSVLVGFFVPLNNVPVVTDLRVIIGRSPGAIIFLNFY